MSRKKKQIIRKRSPLPTEDVTMPKKMKLHSGRVISLPDTITVRSARRNPTKAQLNEVFSAEKDLGFPLEELGDTEEERMNALAKIVFRQVKIKRV